MRLIRVPAGIGDGLWLMQKLVNSGERFDVHLTNSQPQRGKQLYDMLPQVVNSCSYQAGLSYQTIAKLNIQKEFPLWREITEKGFFLSMNEWLENGNRIEAFFPDLETSFTLDYVYSDECNTMPKADKHIGIYCSAYSTVRSWSFWDEQKWFDLIRRVHLREPGACFVIIGALWDIDLGSKLLRLLRLHKIPHFDTIGKPLGWVIDCLKQLDYFISFPSGLPIINESIGKRTFMFYPPHLEPMMHAWADPERIKSHDYYAQLFCEPEEAHDIIKELL